MRRTSWRVTRANVTHAFHQNALLSICGLVRRIDTVLSFQGEDGTIACIECERLVEPWAIRDAV